MTITHYEGKSFANGSNQTVTVINDDELHALGGTFGVIKLRSDPPHWSDDGR
jgi:hypothetical protein